MIGVTTDLDSEKRGQLGLECHGARGCHPHTTEGLDAARSIRQELPDTAILVWSAHAEVEQATELLRSGQRTGYLLEDRITNVDDFLTTLDRIVKGASVVDPALVQELLAARRRGRVGTWPIDFRGRSAPRSTSHASRPRRRRRHPACAGMAAPPDERSHRRDRRPTAQHPLFAPEFVDKPAASSADRECHRERGAPQRRAPHPLPRAARFLLSLLALAGDGPGGAE